MFYKTASIPVVAVITSSGKFHKLASKNAQSYKRGEAFAKQALNLILKMFYERFPKYTIFLMI